LLDIAGRRLLLIIPAVAMVVDLVVMTITLVLLVSDWSPLEVSNVVRIILVKLLNNY